MTPNKSGPGRRSVLKIAGLSVGALLGGSGITAASTAGDQDRQLWVDDGRFVLDLDRTEVSDAQYYMWNAVIRDFNTAIEAGHMDLDKRESVRETGTIEGQGAATVLKINSSPSEIAGGDR